MSPLIRRGRPYNGTELSYEKRSGESDGDAGDKYIGLDRFGRIVDQRWVKSSDGTAKDRFQYGYDRNSNRMYADNLVSSSHSELYHANGSSNGYDSLDQISAWARGTLNGAKDTISSPSTSLTWTYDAQGNWTDYNGQSRTHNKQNEATVVGGNTLTYDTNGNMTTDENGLTFEWDAWNRLVTVKSGETTLLDYEYDALNRRIEEQQNDRDYYYSVAWQVLEEHDNGTADIQYLWSPIYVDAMILRDWDSDANGSLDGREWVQQDANWNVTAIVSNGGTVVERYIYDPFGAVSFLDGSWSSQGSSSYNWTYLFQGRPLEGDSGLYHFRNREHSLSLGRFVSVDPIGFAGGYTNLYVFVGNGPVNKLDPSGLQDENKPLVNGNTIPIKQLYKLIGDPFYQIRGPGSVIVPGKGSRAGELAKFMMANVKPAKPADPAVLKKLIANLDSPSFKVRFLANRELQKLGLTARHGLQEALKSSKVPLEQATRIRRLLAEQEFELESFRFALRRLHNSCPLAQRKEFKLWVSKLARGDSNDPIAQEARKWLAQLEKERKQGRIWERQNPG